MAGLDSCLERHGEAPASFNLCARDQEQLDFILNGDLYSVARAFIRGEYDIRGNMVEAAAYLLSLPRRGAASFLRLLAAWFGPWRLESLVQSRLRAVGMFEHVGRRRLLGYFRKMYALLAPQGLFLNHGIMRPQGIGESAESLILRHRVFPGGELPHLADVIRQAERAGFEVLDVENLRPHYALTCRAWVANLERNLEACLRAVDGETYRTWLLYLSASAVNFERGRTDVHQVLMAKRSHPGGRRLSREHVYRQSD